MDFGSNVVHIPFLALGARLVGLVFIWTGAIKAIAPHTFRNHLRSLELVPEALLGATVTAAAALEVGWGLMLLLGSEASVVYPLTIALLLALSVLTWWGIRSGKTSDCGCYGGFIDPSIRQSMATNAAFCALVLIASVTQRSTSASTAQLGIVVAGTLITALLCGYAQRFERRSGKLLFDTNPLKVGKRWRNHWAGNLTQGSAGEVLIAFLGPDCPFCAQWVKVGNAVLQSPTLPKVIGVLSATADRRESFIRDHGIRFPVASISQSLMGRLAQAVPTTVLVEGGRIRKKWMGAAPPPEFVERVKEAFFPAASRRPLAEHTPSAGLE